MSDFPFIPYRPARVPQPEMQRRGRELYDELSQRRSVRPFSPNPVRRELIELAVEIASTAPSGAHRQPWKFVGANHRNIRMALRSTHSVGTVLVIH